MQSLGFYLSLIALTLAVTIGILRLIYLLRNKKSRYLTLVVFPIVLVIFYYALSIGETEPPIPEPKPVFTLKDIVDIHGGYQGYIINSLGEKEPRILHILKHPHKDSIRLNIISDERIEVLSASYDFEKRLLINQNLDSAFVELKDSIATIKSKNTFNEIWEFTKIR